MAKYFVGNEIINSETPIEEIPPIRLYSISPEHRYKGSNKWILTKYRDQWYMFGAEHDLDSGLSGFYDTIGELVYRTLKYGEDVYIDDVKVSLRDIYDDHLPF